MNIFFIIVGILFISAGWYGLMPTKNGFVYVPKKGTEAPVRLWPEVDPHSESTTASLTELVSGSNNVALAAPMTNQELQQEVYRLRNRIEEVEIKLRWKH